jgi:hypothetical protein
MNFSFCTNYRWKNQKIGRNFRRKIRQPESFRVFIFSKTPIEWCINEQNRSETPVFFFSLFSTFIYGFSIIILCFFMQKFLETKKFFQKVYQKNFSRWRREPKNFQPPPPRKTSAYTSIRMASFFSVRPIPMEKLFFEPAIRKIWARLNSFALKKKCFVTFEPWIWNELGYPLFW